MSQTQPQPRLNLFPQPSPYCESDCESIASTESESKSLEEHQLEELFEATNDIPKQKSRTLKHWMGRFLLTCLWITAVLSPYFICRIFRPKEGCMLFGHTIFTWSLFLSILGGSLFLSMVSVDILMSIIRKTDYLATRLLYYLNALETPIAYFVWSLIALSTRGILFGNDLEIVNIVTNGLVCVVVTTLSLLLKALWLRFFAISFHRGAYYSRIGNALFTEYVLSQFMGLRNDKANRFLGNISIPMLHSNASNRGGKENEKKKSCIEEFGCLSLDHVNVTEKEILSKSFSNYRLAQFIEVIKNRPFLLVQTQDNSDRNAFSNLLDPKPVQPSVARAREAKEFSKRLFEKIKLAGSNQLTADDFLRYLPNSFAHRAFQLFDGNWDGSLTLKEFSSTLFTIIKERKYLSYSLRDSENALKKLDNFITSVMFCVLLVAYTLIFGFDVTKVLTTVSTFLVAIAFAVGNTIKALIDSVSFLFVSHPFDIGDRIRIGEDTFTVHKIKMIQTVLRRYDNTEVYYPNSLLATQPILNLRRSPDQFDIVELRVPFHTPISKLQALESRLEMFLEKQSSNFYKQFEVNYKQVVDASALVVRVWVQHRSNFQNMKKYRERRSKLLLKLKQYMEETGIEYWVPSAKVNEGQPFTPFLRKQSTAAAAGVAAFGQPMHRTSTMNQ